METDDVPGDHEKYPLAVRVLLFLAAIAAGIVFWLIVLWVVAQLP